MTTHRLRLLSSGLLAGLSFAAPADGADAWEWTEKEERTLSKLQRAADVEDDGSVHLREGKYWKVELVGSTRFAAELALYMSLLESAVIDLTGEKREMGAYPTVAVLENADQLKEKTGSSRGIHYRHENRTDMKAVGVIQVRQVENHLYLCMPGDPATATLADVDLAALRAEGTRAVLCGLFGGRGAATWFVEGTAAFLETWDLRCTGRDADETAFEARRQRSPGFAVARRTFDPARPPSLERLLAAPLDAYRKERLVDGMNNAAAAESLVDALFTSRGAKSVRQAVLKEIAQAVARQRTSLVLERKDVARLERLWHEHLTPAAE